MLSFSSSGNSECIEGFNANSWQIDLVYVGIKIAASLLATQEDMKKTYFLAFFLELDGLDVPSPSSSRVSSFTGFFAFFSFLVLSFFLDLDSAAFFSLGALMVLASEFQLSPATLKEASRVQQAWHGQ